MNDSTLNDFKDFVLKSCGPLADRDRALVAADYFLDHGETKLAASAFDLAYGINPHDQHVARLRRDVLDQLSLEKHGVTYRYIPAGTSLLIDETDDLSPVFLDEFWMAETPTTWSFLCDVQGWSPPPEAAPPEELERREMFHLYQEHKIRFQYCETETKEARDWHAHRPTDQWTQAGKTVSAEELFGKIPRDNPERPWSYNIKPMVSVSWQDAEIMCDAISNSQEKFGLPSRAQWEKAARGGLIGCLYPWGNEPPDPSRCDFGHLGEFVIYPPQVLPPNGYGLLGMAGGVWEWTNNAGSEPHSRLLCGGSWTDSAASMMIGFTMELNARSWLDDEWGSHVCPNLGFRTCLKTT